MELGKEEMSVAFLYNMGLSYLNGDGVERDLDEAERCMKKAADEGMAAAWTQLGIIRESRDSVSDEDYAYAVECYETADSQGDLPAKTCLGVLALNGHYPGYTEADGFRMLKEAAAMDDPRANFLIGLCLDEGTGVEKGLEEDTDALATDYFRRSAELGYPEGVSEFSRRLLFGIGTKQDEAAGMAFLKKAAEMGEPNAQFNLGARLLDGAGIAKDSAAGHQWIFKAAEGGHTRALAVAASWYRDGDNAPQDLEKAAVYMERAAARGNVGALEDFADMVYSGSGIPQDRERAFHLFRTAADQGSAYGAARVADSYLRGDGVGKDTLKAVEYYQLAADRGNSSAIIYAGRCYDQGDGVTRDPEVARTYYRKAIEAGDSDACSYLAASYADNSAGNAADYILANFWYQKARETGHPVDSQLASTGKFAKRTRRLGRLACLSMSLVGLFLLFASDPETEFGYVTFGLLFFLLGFVFYGIILRANLYKQKRGYSRKEYKNWKKLRKAGKEAPTGDFSKLSASPTGTASVAQAGGTAPRGEDTTTDPAQESREVAKEVAKRQVLRNLFKGLFGS